MCHFLGLAKCAARIGRGRRSVLDGTDVDLALGSRKREQAIPNTGQSLLSQLENALAIDRVSTFLVAHRSMEGSHCEGFDRFDEAGFDPEVGDKLLKGIDREPTAPLEPAAELIAGHAAGSIGASTESGRRAMQLGAGAVMTMLLLISAFMARFTRRQISDPANRQCRRTTGCGV
jgi:hypothetical protein